MTTSYITTEAVKKIMHLYPGIRAYEVAGKLGISAKTAEKHIRNVRAEWNCLNHQATREDSANAPTIGVWVKI